MQMQRQIPSLVSRTENRLRIDQEQTLSCFYSIQHRSEWLQARPAGGCVDVLSYGLGRTDCVERDGSRSRAWHRGGDVFPAASSYSTNPNSHRAIQQENLNLDIVLRHIVGWLAGWRDVSTLGGGGGLGRGRPERSGLCGFGFRERTYLLRGVFGSVEIMVLVFRRRIAKR